MSESEKGSVAAAKVALSRPCVLVIVMAGVERFANKGMGSNLVTYLTGVVGMSTAAAAAKSVVTWTGVSFMLPLLSSILTDSYWDRYSTLAASSLLYVLGMVSLTVWALLRPQMPRPTLFIPLYLMAVGQGGYQPTLQAFGADQLGIGDDDAEPGLTAEEKGKVKSMFFQWWYFGICSGSLLGNSTMSYVQDNFGWVLGFAIPSGVMALSVAAFFCCTPLYRQTQPKGASGKPSSPSGFCKVLKSILAGRKISLPSMDDNGGTMSELELQEKPLKAEPGDANKEGVDEAAPSMGKVILGLLPIWAILLIFAVIFQQPMTFFTKQGMLMDHTVGRGAFVIPPAMLQSSITVSIILLVPMYDRVIIPLINAVTRGSDGITVLQRIGVGMVLSVVAMAIAALVESWRLRVSAASGGAYRLKIFWLLPQYVLLGVSDVFTVVGMQEFFYTQVPSSMKTISIGLYLSVFGVGGFLGAFLITVLEMATARPGNSKGWFSDDPREAHLDNYYWFLALLCFISFVIFTHLCKFYSSKNASGK
ncbi:protein NRT1/ PTR FAMILY 5.8-like [Panicum virgatum]|uniref:Protein NRT1/ PTR FAMILY 5.8 n=2 Tax=Panicum virgatum TaxID=38727 RepID=A0A8T0T4J4_PANVG|nr:protein NRT1/ PTR FAMILY 5.8-like [Panicum virgatum]KAG2605217.1 hypothetical protein PVAP13_4NG107300 [Panicum virgatum]